MAIVVTGITTGIPPHPTAVDYPVRLEWSEFAQNMDYVTLYVKALEAYKALSQAEDVPNSYFQIGGIHGLPLTPWDGVNEDDPNNYQYCHHGSTTFPTWHRPYVALYEQFIAANFDDVIAQYSGPLAASLKDSAQTWRLPYWEWAAAPSIPEEWASENISIWGTDGSVVPEPNPFLVYLFNPIDDSFTSVSQQIATWPSTLRQPSSNDPDASSRPDVVNSALKSRRLKQGVLNLFRESASNPWDHFSNDSWTPGQLSGPISSLEQVHNSVHVAVGGANPSGHMIHPEVAAFDPIFWMHHCQVERLLSLWQAVNYSVTVPGSPADLDKPLDPFRKNQADTATSRDVQSTTTYGYIYPEIKAAGNASQQAISQSVYDAVERLYGGGSFSSAILAPNKKIAADKAVESLSEGVEKVQITPTVHENSISIPVTTRFTAVPKAQRDKPPAPSNPGHDNYTVTPETYRDWVANVTLEKYSLGGSGSVAFFLGPIDEIPVDPAEWHSCPIYVGAYDIFALAPANRTGCGNCHDQQERGMHAGGSVYLTEALIHRRVPLVGNEPEEYLTENLHWRCHGLQGHISRENVPSLEVIVQSAGYVLSPGRGDGRPDRTPWLVHGSVTRGKLGGIKEAHDS